MDPVLDKGAILDNRYELSDPLGEGSFGQVWLARDSRLGGKRVAIKILHRDVSRDPRIVERFENEMRALAVVNHPNVVSISDFGQWESRHYLVVEWVEGQSLFSWLNEHRDRGVLPALSEIRPIFSQLCAAVAAAHEARDPGPIIHRDIKPENVMIRRPKNAGAPFVKLLDFGVASLASHRMTQAGARIGTTVYMPPEQYLGNTARVCTASDVFSLAVVLVEMLTLSISAPDGRDWWSVSWLGDHSLVHGFSAVRIDISASVWQCIATALHKLPEHRPQDAAAFARLIEEHFESEESASTVAVPLVASAPVPPAVTSVGEPPLLEQKQGISTSEINSLFASVHNEPSKLQSVEAASKGDNKAPLSAFEQARLAFLLKGTTGAIREIEEMDLAPLAVEQAAELCLWRANLLAELDTDNAAAEYELLLARFGFLSERINAHKDDVCARGLAARSRRLELVTQAELASNLEHRAELYYRAARIARVSRSHHEAERLRMLAYTTLPTPLDGAFHERWRFKEGEDEKLFLEQKNTLFSIKQAARTPVETVQTWLSEATQSCLVCWRYLHPNPDRVEQLIAVARNHKSEASMSGSN